MKGILLDKKTTDGYTKDEVNGLVFGDRILEYDPVPFTWGAEPTNSSGSVDGVGDKAWWDALSIWCMNSTLEERQACVGKTKRLPLGGTYLGSDYVIMRCIGADQDGPNTLAFNAVAALATSQRFDNAATWYNSTVKEICQQIYETCAAKDAIKVVLKGTVDTYDGTRNAKDVIYTNETIFILSEREYGLDYYSAISVANSTETRAECTYGYNTNYTYYEPSNNSKRIMYLGDANGNSTTSYAYPWERSRHYYNANGVCGVYNNGTASSHSYSNSSGLAPAFVLGKNTSVAINKGGTGLSISPSALINLSSHSSAKLLEASLVRPGVNGVLSVENGGTGGATAAAARENLEVLTEAEIDELYMDRDSAYTKQEVNAKFMDLVNPNHFEWGDENEEATEEWISKLETWISYASTDGKKSCLGKTKKVTLTSAVQGTTEHYIRCVGYDRDGVNTLTFQTVNTLATGASFGSVQWSSSTAKSTVCNNYYNALPFKSHVKQVSKVTVTGQTGTTTTTTTEKVFIPSIYEMGVLSYANKPQALEYSDTANLPYQYYDTPDRRVKLVGTTTTTATYFTRSRSTGNSNYLCYVTAAGAGNQISYSTAYYFAPAFAIGSWDWGAEPTDSAGATDGIGDAEWWAGLKAWASSVSPSARATCLGKTKRMQLSTPVLGSNYVIMQCIGYDLDGENTLAFQTKNTLVNNTVYAEDYDGIEEDNYAALGWSWSPLARTLCEDFYAACAAKDSILQVNKGTCNEQVRTRDGQVEYEKQYVFLPSMMEMGTTGTYSSLRNSNASVHNAEATYGYMKGYQLYTANADRIKYYSDANGNSTGSANWYWCRSRYCSNAYNVCGVDISGGASYNYYGNSYGLAPAFVL